MLSKLWKSLCLGILLGGMFVKWIAPSNASAESLARTLPPARAEFAISAAIATPDLGLGPLSTFVISGVVSDAATGGPLHAKLTIAGFSDVPLWTDPATGFYRVALPGDVPYTFQVEAAGYLATSLSITPFGDRIENFSLSSDLALCAVSNAALASGAAEDFNRAVPPAGWTVVDNAGAGVIWKTISAWGDGNYTGGTGEAAAVNSGKSGYAEVDTELRSPTFATAGLSGLLTYRASFQNYAYRDYLDLDLRLDGGEWTNILRWNEDHGSQAAGPGEMVSVNLSPYLRGVTSFQLRWRYYDPNVSDYNWYVQVDDILLQGCPANSK